ncbi:hypothetical protein KQI86_00110 [Clostridium sp. MSJ-11]|uniref:Uncharacterized protein n=1 Tax=Clostridium mobile TaxID=2841512 RepID=A0ABS6EBX5_9CLOT|nr:hypothetical protein [Clostridium mobile]MBU5482704.1 hypothetical protein [Clostridium mobile]
MLKKVVVLLITFILISSNVSAKTNIDIEIFDISKEKVIMKVPSNPTIQKEVQNYIEGIESIYSKFNPIPDKGYMIKIPVENPIMIQNQFLNTFVDVVIIIFPQEEEPYLMVFDDKDRMIFFRFQGNTDALIKNLNFNPNTLR